MNPIVLHVVRPYSSEAELLAAEAWTVDARSMLLLEQEPLAPETVVMFDVSLDTGERLVRAEGRVASYVAPTAEHAGGLRVRFKRYGSQTKAFVERAVAYRREQLLEANAGTTPASVPHAAEKAPPPVAVDAAAAPLELAAAAVLPPIVTAAVPAAPALAATAPSFEPAPNLGEAKEVRDASGIHRRPASKVEAPQNRDELLARLRDRLAKTRPETEPVIPASDRAG